MFKKFFIKKKSPYIDTIILIEETISKLKISGSIWYHSQFN